MLHFQELPDQKVTETPLLVHPQRALRINSSRIAFLSNSDLCFAECHDHVILRSHNMYKISVYVSIPLKKYFFSRKKRKNKMLEKRCYREPYFKIWSKIPKSN